MISGTSESREAGTNFEQLDLAAASSVWMQRGPIGRRIVDPTLDCGCAPPRAAGTDLDALGESAGFHLPVERRTREACQGQHRLEPENAINSIGLHRDYLALFKGVDGCAANQSAPAKASRGEPGWCSEYPDRCRTPGDCLK